MSADLEKTGTKPRAGHGGPREGSGRKPGVAGRLKRELAEMAQEHAPAALEALAEIMRTGDSAAARVSAANSILDRAYGKPFQAVKVGGDPDGEPIKLETDAAEVARKVAFLLASGQKAADDEGA